MGYEDLLCSLAEVDLRSPREVERVRRFLAPLGFEFDPRAVEETAILETEDGRIAGTGSFQRDVLMFLAVDPAFRETACAARLVTHLVEKIRRTGSDTAFIFTRPANRPIFEGLGFQEIATAPPLFTLLEFGFRTATHFAKELEARRWATRTSEIAAIVMNCNPFTKGHRFLIERAAAENEVVYLFVVEEDRSDFPFEVRFDLVSRGVADLGNVQVLKGGRYVVSNATFPTYFLKREAPDAVTRNQAELDLAVFTRWIAPPLGIRRRYVGTERDCPTTAVYNAAMRRILPPHGIDLIEIPRLTWSNGGAAAATISASWIRRAIRENRLRDVLSFVPEVTREFLLSERAQPVLERVRRAG